MDCTIPVILLIYRRPAETARVFAALRAARPPHLIVVADGPRAERAEDAAAVAATRAVVAAVDWPCRVTRIYADTNLGLRNRVESGLHAAFALVERAIILEDDCLPAASFFRFCAELLDRYADDARIMMVSGNNFQPGRPPQGSYRFSRYTHCWGWATWRRAWLHYDSPMADWPRLRASDWLEGYLGDRRAARYWRRTFDLAYTHGIDTWDYTWLYSCWRQRGLALLPTRNLVSNIGFGPMATHTTATYNAQAALPVYDLAFPLRHPRRVAADTRADNYTQNVIYDPNLLRRIIGFVGRKVRAVRGGHEESITITV